jgi:hypothetical protein
MANRRDLSFARLDQIMPEVDRLLTGHATVGQWSLGQICHHLALALRYSAAARSPVPEPTPEQAALRERFFAAGKFPEGRPAPPPMEPRPGLDDQVEADRLRAAIDHFTSASGPCPTHPALGPLDHQQWAQFHCMHAAHHLGFAVPQE